MNYVSKNWVGLGMIAAGVLGIVALGFMQGCSVDRLFTVHVPERAQQITGAPAKVTLEEAPAVLAQFDAAFKADRAAFVQNIEDASWFASVIKSAIAAGGPIAIAGVGEVPGGTILLSALTGLGGLMLNKPGTAKRTQEAVAEAVELELGKALSSKDAEKQAELRQAEERFREKIDATWDEAVRETERRFVISNPPVGA